MNVPDLRSDPFSADDEAFFQSGVESDEALLSERPVTLDETFDAEPSVASAPESAEREARRARFVRPVAWTLAVLSALALVGLVRSSVHVEPAFAAESTTAVARPAAASEAPVAVSHDIAADFVAPDAHASLLMSACDHAPASEARATLPDVSETHASDTTFTQEHESGVANTPDSRTSQRRAASETTASSRSPKPAPVTKSALLSAIRASRPAHVELRKTL
jgi:hypothetical protein